jgi:hypothetical protein
MPSPDFLMSIAVAVVLATAWLAWVVMGPAISFRMRHWHDAVSEFEPCRSDSLAPGVTQIVDDLQQLGFRIRGYWRHSGHSRARAVMAVLEHPRTYDVAKPLITSAGKRSHVTLLLQTRFDDGTEVNTGNNVLTIGLPALPGHTGLWLPQVRDSRELYRIHEQVSRRLEAGKTRIAIGPDPEAFLIEGRDRVLAHHVATGYYYYDRNHDVLRPTWKGAFLMTWRLRWPVRPLFFARRRRRTQKLLRELGIAVAG